ncbi:MAG: RDD family protein [Ignavibacteriae bacterium]|nr:RDD family protein [Ignavibacteriota bacterium]
MENNQSFKLAGRGKRIANFIVDMIAFFVVWILISLTLAVLDFDYSYVDETGQQIPIASLILLIPTYWGYFLFTEYKFQKTLGKIITKTILVSDTGGKPSFKQILIRTLCRSIPFEYFSYFGTVEGTHDRLSKTRVIEE